MLHHSLNYSIGGTIGPANAVTAYLDWPGSPFVAQTITGAWNHPSLTRFVLYLLDLLFGKRGFVWHNLPLFWALIAAPPIWWLKRRERPELLHAFAWSIGTWLLYGATSTNSAGVCCSIRWLVPLLAPGYLALAILLRDRPDLGSDFLLLSAWGAIYSAVTMVGGPWHEINPLVNWLLVAGAGVSWLLLRRFWRSRAMSATSEIESLAA
jgi:hypothetical protein